MEAQADQTPPEEPVSERSAVPSVSVVIPVRDGERYLEELLDALGLLDHAMLRGAANAAPSAPPASPAAG